MQGTDLKPSPHCAGKLDPEITGSTNFVGVFFFSKLMKMSLRFPSCPSSLSAPSPSKIHVQLDLRAFSPVVFLHEFQASLCMCNGRQNTCTINCLICVTALHHFFLTLCFQVKCKTQNPHRIFFSRLTVVWLNFLSDSFSISFSEFKKRLHIS